MVVVVIIGLLAAAGLPTYRHITLRSKATATVNDLRAFSAPFIAANLQNGAWPETADNPRDIPTAVAGALPSAFINKTPIGGYYKWNFDTSAGGLSDIRAAITIEPTADNPINDDLDLLKMIDAQMDDGDLNTGSLQQGAYYSLVYIIEK